MTPDVPGSVAELGDTHVSYALRTHLAIAHHLPAGWSYLVPRDQLAAFHDEAHARPSRLAGWVRLLRLRRARRHNRGEHS